MTEPGIGRLLVASLHQAIADLLPTRLEFYESWLNPAGLRHGRIGHAPLAAVLSFLRQEGDAYRGIAGRAGEYTAEWTVADLPPVTRTVVRAAPDWLRPRLALWIARRLARSAYGGSDVQVRWRKGTGQMEIRGSIFCEVREPVAAPLCEFYAAAVRRLLYLFNVQADVAIQECRGTGADRCRLAVGLRELRA